MAQEYPLIRVPTQAARVRLVDLIAFMAFVGGITAGGLIGLKNFGLGGAVAGVVLGGLVGAVVGLLPNYLFQEQLFREMQRSSDEQLRAKLENPVWAFYQTLALLNLHLRGENVDSYLPRVLALLESTDDLTRLFARDALRLVFTPLAVKLDEFGYDPKSSASDCQRVVAQFRETLARPHG